MGPYHQINPPTYGPLKCLSLENKELVLSKKKKNYFVILQNRFTGAPFLFNKGGPPINDQIPSGLHTYLLPLNLQHF